VPQTTPPSDAAHQQHTAAAGFMEIAGLPLHSWITAGVTLAILVLVYILLRFVIGRQLKRLAARTSTQWDDIAVGALERLRLWLIGPALVYAAAQSLNLSTDNALLKDLKVLAMIGVGVQILLSAQSAIDASIQVLLKRARTHDGLPDPTLASSASVLRIVAIAVIGVLVILLALDNLGFSITSLITGLGIGGVAVALAVQNILGDLFASVSILLDKPFVVGDSIQVGDKSGTVERIGIKTTRVRATTGEELIFANTDLLTSRVQNFKRMRERRVSFIVQLVYDTAPDKLTRMPGIVRSAVEAQQNVRFDRCHFRSFGANGLEFECVYFVLTPSYTAYMDAQQAINLDITRGCAAGSMQIAPNGQPFARATPAPPQSTSTTLGPKPPTPEQKG
jgi:small-conductance mechanosensitive channel